MKLNDLPSSVTGLRSSTNAVYEPPLGSTIPYSALRRALGTQFATQGKSAQVVKNYHSALKQFLESLGLNEFSVVGTELRDGFDAALQRHLEFMKGEKKSKTSTLRDRVSILLRWKHALEILDYDDTLPPDFAECLKILVKRSGLSVNTVKRSTGRSHKLITSWIRGDKAPGVDSLQTLRDLESLLGVTPGTIVSRTTLEHRARLKNCTQPVRKIAYRVRQGQVIRHKFRLVDGTPQLRDEWSDYVSFKTSDFLREGDNRYSTWRITPLERASIRVKWYTAAGGGICPTAGFVWDSFATFFGYLALSPNASAEPEQTGLGFDKEALSLAWLSDFDLVQKYLTWKKLRSGGILHNGAIHFIVSVKSLLNPKTGYLYQRPEFFHRLPENTRSKIREMSSDSDVSALWRLWCETSFKRMKSIYSQLKQSRIKKGRDPQEPIQEILDSPQPLAHLRRFVESMEAARPMECTQTRWLSYCRDLLLVKMLITNPLRIHNYSTMTWRPDNTGQLYKRADGTWMLRIPPEAFKNERGAAKELYHVELSPLLWDDIERYLTRVRPRLYKPEWGDYCFRPLDAMVIGKDTMTDCGAWAASPMSVHIVKVTRRYVPGSPGFGPHAFRHVVATHLLKQPETRGDFLTVAKVLHDELKTVLAEYGHVTTGDGARAYNDHLLSVFKD